MLVTVLKIEPRRQNRSPKRHRRSATHIALDRAKKQVQDLHDKIEDDRAGGSTLEEAAQKLKLPVVTFDVDRSGRDPDGKLAVNLPHGPDIVSGAFASDVGVDNDPIDVDGGYVWYDVAAITPARDRTLDEVKGAVDAALARRRDRLAAERPRPPICSTSSRAASPLPRSPPAKI